MKECILITLLFIQTCCCFGQGVKEIIVESQRLNEPPTIPPPALYQIKFERTKKGDFKASAVQELLDKSSEKTLKDDIVLSKEKVNQTNSWLSNNKSSFSFTDLNTDLQQINNAIVTHQLTLAEKIDEDFMVKVDSFNFCNSFDNRRTMVIGGAKLNVTLKLENGDNETFSFEAGDFGTEKFNLRDYLIFYPLLKDKIPIHNEASDFFNETQLLRVLLHYLDTIECEGFYYNEFISIYPERTPKENRMRVGWNFEEYMRNRKKQ